MNLMIEQINDIPNMIKQSVAEIDDSVRRTLDHEMCLSLKRLFITGCGDSHHAALGSEMAIEKISGIPVEPVTALQFSRYSAGFIPQLGPGTNIVIGISVSGSVVRTAEALKMGQEFGATTIALTANQDSLVGSSAQHVLLAKAPQLDQPQDAAIPGVRTFHINQLALILTAIRIGEVRGNITTPESDQLRRELVELAEAAQITIDKSNSAAKELVSSWADADEFVFAGAGPNFATALFSAAKVLEASGDSALGQDLEEWAHLQYFVKKADIPTIFISSGDQDLSRFLELAPAAKQIGRRTAVISPELEQLKGSNINHLPIAKTREMFSHIIAPIPGELLAAYRSDLIKEPFFRNFSSGRMSDEGDGASRIRSSQSWDKWEGEKSA
ncbi:MAG: SIS domain-containing protein [Anaerolineaceae bacterium]|nr:SIS domain-containing protein [Anaerolineaceae bacterium]